MSAPPHGLVVPVEVKRVIDGDTVVVRVIGTLREPTVRLLECYAPEIRTEAGKKAKQFAESVLAKAKDVRLQITVPKKHARGLLGIISLKRVLGHIWCDGENLGELLVRAGLASATEPEKKPEKKPKKKPRVQHDDEQ